MGKALKTILFLFLILSCTPEIRVEDKRHELLYLFKSFDYDGLGKQLSDFPNGTMKSIFMDEYAYMKKGNDYDVKKYLLKDCRDYLDSAIYFNAIARYFERPPFEISGKDTSSVVYTNYFKVFDLGRRNNDTILINLGLKGLNYYYLRNPKDRVNYKKYVSYLKDYEKDKIDRFWKQ